MQAHTLLSGQIYNILQHNRWQTAHSCVSGKMNGAAIKQHTEDAAGTLAFTQPCCLVRWCCTTITLYELAVFMLHCWLIGSIKKRWFFFLYTRAFIDKVENLYNNMQELGNADLITVKPVFIIQKVCVLSSFKLIFCALHDLFIDLKCS